MIWILKTIRDFLMEASDLEKVRALRHKEKSIIDRLHPKLAKQLLGCLRAIPEFEIRILDQTVTGLHERTSRIPAR